MNRMKIAQPDKTPAFLPTAHGVHSSLNGKSVKDETASEQTNSREFSEPRFAHDFGKIRVSPAQPMIPQPDLVLGQVGDRFEQEADSVADSVMRFPMNSAERSRPPSVSMGMESLHRASDETASDTPAAEANQNEAAADAGNQTDDTAKTEANGQEESGSPEQVAALLLESDNLEDDAGTQGAGEEQQSTAPTGEGDESTMQTKELAGQTPTVSPNQASRINALRGGGQPLSTSSRTFFEPRFGHDLSHVRIHTGVEAGRLAQSVQARAFTVGRDVVFGEGHYQPASPSGQWLMAHELTHVLQQQEGLSRSPIGGVQVQHTGRPQLQGGFWGKLWGGIKKGASAVWGGIKKGASAVWGGIKKGASAVWRGIKWAGGKVWGGIKAVSRWGWNVLKSGAALAWRQVVNFPERVWKLIKHLGSGIAGVASWLWDGLKLLWHLDFKGMGKWLLDGILSGAAWVGRLVGKLIDVAGIGEVWDLIFQIIKFNTRSLTSEETTEAKKTFKSSISYWQVRIDEYSLISAIGAAFKGGGGMGVTTFHTINFNKGITATAGSADMHWLTHELTHVSQYEHAGTQYLGEAIYAQATVGYDYKGPSALWRPLTNASPNTLGKHFREFNREQQADIAADYYYSLYSKAASGGFTPVTTDYEPVIDELRAGDI